MSNRIKNAVLAIAVLIIPRTGSADPVLPPRLTVASLFEEALVGLHSPINSQHWAMAGHHPLTIWPRGEPSSKAAGLLRIQRTHFHIPVTALTQKPVRLTTDAESLRFFQGVPEQADDIPRDGSMIGFKYAFYPNSVVHSNDRQERGKEPIVFFMLRKATPDLTEADLEPPLEQDAEDAHHRRHVHRYDAYSAYLRLHERGQAEEALKRLRESALGGYCQAQLALAKHEWSKQSPGSHAQAREWYRLAAEQGMPQAQHCHGAMLCQGEGGPADPAAARLEFRHAADQGHVESQFTYAFLLRQGLGGAVDWVTARAYFQMAADQGHPEAQYSLAVMLRLGEGGWSDPSMARTLVQSSAEQGYREAQYAYACMLETGEGGPQDLPAARAHYQLAANQGHLKAKRALETWTGPPAPEEANPARAACPGECVIS